MAAYLYLAYGKLYSDLSDFYGASTLYDPYVFDCPILYAGQYYDYETGLYYLRARYYSPDLCRFTSEDPIKDGLNWYAYCTGNPVAFVDVNGLWIHIAIGAFVGAAISTAVSIATQLATTGEVKLSTTLIAAGGGALSGALAATGFGLVAQVVGNGLISGAADITTQLADNGWDIKELDPWSIATSVGVGMAAGLIGGPGANGNNYLKSLSDQFTKRIGNALAYKTGATLIKEIKNAFLYFIKSSGTTTKEMVINIIRSNIPASMIGGLEELNLLIKEIEGLFE